MTNGCTVCVSVDCTICQRPALSIEWQGISATAFRLLMAKLVSCGLRMEPRSHMTRRFRAPSCERLRVGSSMIDGEGMRGRNETKDEKYPLRRRFGEKAQKKKISQSRGGCFADLSAGRRARYPRREWRPYFGLGGWRNLARCSADLR